MPILLIHMLILSQPSFNTYKWLVTRELAKKTSSYEFTNSIRKCTLYLLAFFNSLTKLMDCWWRISEVFSCSRSLSNFFVSSWTFSFSRPSRFSACSRSRDIAEVVTSACWIPSTVCKFITNPTSTFSPQI